MQTIISPALQETAQSLIDNLLASEAFVRYQQSQVHLNTNSEASALLNQLSLAQTNVRKKQANGGVSQTEIDSLRELQQKVQRNQIIMDYAQSQQEAVNFLREINAEISQLLGINFATFAQRSSC